MFSCVQRRFQTHGGNCVDKRWNIFRKNILLKKKKEKKAESSGATGKWRLWSGKWGKESPGCQVAKEYPEEYEL